MIIKNPKKIISVILLNLLFFVFIFFTIEFIIYEKSVIAYKRLSHNIVENFPYPKFFQSYRVAYSPHVIQYYDGKRPLMIRPFSLSPEHIKTPILLFGGSYTNGSSLLKDNEAFGYKLSEYSNRDVYNFGMCSCGIQHMLFIIRNYLFKNFNLNNPPEYAIYTYIPNHLMRLRFTVYPNMFFNGTMLHYKKKNNNFELEEKHFPFLYNLFSVKAIYHYLDLKMHNDTIRYNEDNFILANELFLESRRELQERFPDIKFVIMKFQFENDDSMVEVPYMWDVLKKEGFIIVETEELVGRKFRYNSEDTTVDGYHPTPQVWDLIIPKLAEKLKI